MKDELNVFEQYFSTMEISDKQKKDRTALAREFFDAFMFFFEIAQEAIMYSKDYKLALDRLAADIGKVVKPNDDYLKEYVEKISNEVFTTTFLFGSAYYFSEKRAFGLAVNEANSVENYRDFKVALGRYKTKTWIAEIDERTRLDHLMMDGITIPIDDLFLVGTSYMRFPKDIKYDPAIEEIANCRCSIIYK